MPSSAPTRARRTREWWLLGVAAVAIYALLAPFAWYGIDLSDEGYIVYPSVQILSGLVPYRDVNSLYTPLPWYFHALVLQVVGVELVPLRLLFAGVATILALGHYALARQFMRPWLAFIPLVAFVLVFPIPRTWAPYPAWYALGGLLIALLAFGHWLERRGDRWLMVVGLGCALAFGGKPNLGLFGILAFGGFLLLRARVLATLPEANGPVLPSWALPTLQVGFVLAVSAALTVLIGGVAAPGNVALLLGTLLAIGLLLIERPARGDRLSLVVDGVRRGLWIAVPFIAATALWYVPLSIAAGWGLTFDTVFRNGARTAAAFYQPIPLPSRDALESLMWVVAGLGLALSIGVLARRWRLGVHATAGIAAVLALGAVAILAGRARQAGVSLPHYVQLNFVTRFGRPVGEEGDFLMYLPFLVLWLTAGLLLWWRWRGRSSGPGELRVQALAWFSSLLLFQLYPRASYLHLLFSIGPVLVLLAILRAEIWRFLGGKSIHPAWRATALALLLVFPALALPGAWREREQALQQDLFLALPHAGVWVDQPEGTQMQFAARNLASLPPGAPVFVYPADPMIYLLTDHPNPTREDYLPAGYLDTARQQDVIDRLKSTRTRFVIWDQDQVDRWGLAATDRLLVDYIWRSYQPVSAERAWILLERNAH